MFLLITIYNVMLKGHVIDISHGEKKKKKKAFYNANYQLSMIRPNFFLHEYETS